MEKLLNSVIKESLSFMYCKTFVFYILVCFTHEFVAVWAVPEIIIIVGVSDQSINHERLES